MLEFVKTQNLKPNDILAKTIYSDDFRVLLKQGNKLTPFVITQIQKLGYKGCYIEHAETHRRELIPLTEPIIDDDERIALVQDIKSMFANHQTFDEPLCTSFKLQRQNIEKAVKNLVDQVYNKVNGDGFLYETEDCYRTFNNWIYHHTFNTCVISIGICAEMGLTRSEAYNVAVGAIYHDYGKAYFGEAFYNKVDFNDEERERMQQHPEIMFRILQRLNYPVSTSYAVWQHHEKAHGKGYPLALHSSKITLSAKIVALASAFDNLVTYQSYKQEPMSQQDALEFLQACDSYDIDCMRAMFNFIVPYPVGSKVLLSNGKMGLVLKNVKGCVMRPYVVVDDGLYDLANDMQYMNVTIEKCYD